MTAKIKKTKTDKKNTHTISLVVNNKPGVLVRTALVFARRGFNIDSLVVSPSVDPRFSSMTITAKGDPSTLEQIIKQSAKLVDVIHSAEHKPEETIEKELALFKVRLKPATKTNIQKLLKKFHAHAVDVTDNTLVAEITATTDMLDEFEVKLKKYGIIEMIRSGKLAVTRGKDKT